MDFIPTISDFVIDTDFIALQNKFSAYDERHITPEGEMTHKTYSRKDFDIIFKSFNSESKEVYNNVFFYRDFLPNCVFKMADIEIGIIEKRIAKEFQFNNHERKNFIEHQIAVYKEYDIAIFGSIFLDDHVKVMLSTQTRKVLEFLYDDIILKDIYKTDDKMKFKMNKNDIQMLFFLLRQAKLIDHVIDADLGRLIDNFFVYYSSESETFLEMKRSGKELNDYKNVNKTAERAIERLKAIFTDQNFYEIKG